MAGCSPAPHESKLTPSTPSTSAPPPRESPGTKDPVADPVPVVIPECSGVMTDEQVAERLSPEFASWEGPERSGAQLPTAIYLGPVAQRALAAATQVRPCYWGVPLSDVVVSMFVAELPTAERVRLVSDLRDSAYAESNADGVTLFTHSTDDGIWKQTNWYGFLGDVWVASFHQGEQVPIEIAFENIRAANPEWAPATP